MNPIDRLRDEITGSGLVTAPQSGDGYVFGTARMQATGTDVNVNIDPEFDDRPDTDTPSLLAAVERVLTVADGHWRRIVGSVAEDR